MKPHELAKFPDQLFQLNGVCPKYVVTLHVCTTFWNIILRISLSGSCKEANGAEIITQCFSRNNCPSLVREIDAPSLGKRIHINSINAAVQYFSRKRYAWHKLSQHISVIQIGTCVGVSYRHAVILDMSECLRFLSLHNAGPLLFQTGPCFEKW